MRSTLNRLLQVNDLLNYAINVLQPAVGLAARLYVAKVFFLPGLTKVQAWKLPVDKHRRVKPLAELIAETRFMLRIQQGIGQAALGMMLDRASGV